MARLRTDVDPWRLDVALLRYEVVCIHLPLIQQLVFHECFHEHVLSPFEILGLLLFVHVVYFGDGYGEFVATGHVDDALVEEEVYEGHLIARCDVACAKVAHRILAEAPHATISTNKHAVIQANVCVIDLDVLRDLDWPPILLQLFKLKLVAVGLAPHVRLAVYHHGHVEILGAAHLLECVSVLVKLHLVECFLYLGRIVNELILMHLVIKTGPKFAIKALAPGVSQGFLRKGY